MTKFRAVRRTVFAALVLCAATPALAQVRPMPPAAAMPQIDPATIPLPNLAFTPTPQIAATYDKYFYFNRADTDFAAAYADVRECDDYARGLSYHTAYQQAPYPYAGTLTGALGGAIANVVADAVFGSAERRRQRRVNVIACMRFKEYRVYGLPENLWEQFNFEEGNRTVPEQERQRLLQIQARVASGPAPTVGEVTQ
jgi:hypothetical protein